jgi:hypothetical protein
MYDWPLNDAVLACVAAIIIGSIVTTLTTVRRAEFFRLQNEVKQLSMMQNEVKRLSKKITALEVDDERRFLVELINQRVRWRTALQSDSLRPRPHGPWQTVAHEFDSRAVRTRHRSPNS